MTCCCMALRELRRCSGAVEELLQLARTVRPAAAAAGGGGTADGTGDERFGGGSSDRTRGFVLFLAKLSLAATFLPRHVQKYKHV